MAKSLCDLDHERPSAATVCVEFKSMRASKQFAVEA